MFKIISRKKKEQVSFTNEGFTLAKQVTEELEQAEEDGMYFDQMYGGFPPWIPRQTDHPASVVAWVYRPPESVLHADWVECSDFAAVVRVFPFKDC